MKAHKAFSNEAGNYKSLNDDYLSEDLYSDGITAAYKPVADKKTSKKLARTFGTAIRNAMLITGGVTSIVAPMAIYAEEGQKQTCPYLIAFSDFEGGTQYVDDTNRVEGLKKEIPDVLWRELRNKGFKVIENDFLKAKLAKKNIKWADFLENPYLAVGVLDDVDIIVYGRFDLKQTGRLEILAKYIDQRTGDIVGTEFFDEDAWNYEAGLPRFAEGIAIDLNGIKLK